MTNHRILRTPEDVEALLGTDVVLLPVDALQKKPSIAGWQKTTLERSKQPDWRAQFKRKGCNIGVLLGEVSGHMCTVDCDNDDFLAEMLRLNPALAGTLQTRRVRGGNLWLRVTGNYWPKTVFIKRTDSGETVGEWRTGGAQTMIAGSVLDASKGETEPTDYKVMVDAPPVTMAFEEIRWPDFVTLPWEESVRTDCYANMEKRYGAPFFCGKNDSIHINEYGFAGKLATENLVLYEPKEGQFYLYDAGSGLWKARAKSAMLEMVSNDWQRYAILTNTESQLLPKRTAGRSQSILTHLGGITGRENVFAKSDDVIHVTNGMLHLLGSGVYELRAFDSSYYSRNQIPIAFNAAADCPRFLSELLAGAMEPDDVSLLQRYCGSVLLRGNMAQRILLMDGTAGGGKSTIVEIIEAVIGCENVCELRTAHLNERFEISRFNGKLLLAGKDVAGDFLMTAGAAALKKLVGGDGMDAERKNSNACIKQRGEYAVIITCNSRLRVKLDGDAGAWRRRLLMIPFRKPKPACPVAEFGRLLLREEGEGILRWMIEGAIQHKAELEQHGNFVLTREQAKRADGLLAESDSIRFFVSECIERDDAGDLWTKEITDGYLDYCDAQCWQPFPVKAVEKALPDLMAELHRSNKSDKVERDGKRERGYLKVRLKQQG